MAQRTDQQNKALHLWCRQSSRALNQDGITYQQVFEFIVSRGIELPWDSDGKMFKYMFQQILLKVYGDDKTSNCDTTDYDPIYNGLIKLLGQEFGVTLPPWPNANEPPPRTSEHE
jgi:hypothetical protein